MAYRRGRQLRLPDYGGRRPTNNMDQLAFKYMEMCKVESSTESDSEISPRWSDTSTMGCVSSAPESGAFCRLSKHKSAGRQIRYSTFLDPYDGSSEDSDAPINDVGLCSRRQRQHARGGGGSGHFLGRSRHIALQSSLLAVREAALTGTRDPMDVQMKCASDSELLVCVVDSLPSRNDGCRGIIRQMLSDSATHPQSMDTEVLLPLVDQSSHAARLPTSRTPAPPTPTEYNSSQLPDSSLEQSPSPCVPSSFYKRKLALPGAEEMDVGQRKRQCVNMEEEQRV